MRKYYPTNSNPVDTSVINYMVSGYGVNRPMFWWRRFTSECDLKNSKDKYYGMKE